MRDEPRAYRRLVLTFGAQIYSQIVTIGVQLTLVPLLLHFWGTEIYGIWLLLSAVPSYLTFADLGFTLSAKNEMTIKTARGDQMGALVTYQTTLVMLTGVASLVLVSLLAILSVLDIRSIFSIGGMSNTSAKLALLLLACSVLLSQYTLLLSAGFRCVGRPAEETIWAASARFAEGFAVAAVAGLGGDIVGACIAIVLIRTGLNGLAWLRLRKLAPWLHLGYRCSSPAELRKLLHPSLSFMSQSFAQVVMIQGPVIVLGTLAGPTQVVVFSTCRTLTRLGTSVTNLFNASFLPEYSATYFQYKARFSKSVRLHFMIALLCIICYVVSCSILGPSVVEYWTKGVVKPEFSWFFALTLSVAAEMTWTTLFIPIASINRHIMTANIFGLISVIYISVISLFVGSFGLLGISVLLVSSHCLMILVVLFELDSQLRDSTEQD
jgi:O-antigen/teichoic acid export membrane protein